LQITGIGSPAIVDLLFPEASELYDREVDGRHIPAGKVALAFGFGDGNTNEVMTSRSFLRRSPSTLIPWIRL